MVNMPVPNRSCLRYRQVHTLPMFPHGKGTSTSTAFSQALAKSSTANCHCAAFSHALAAAANEIIVGSNANREKEALERRFCARTPRMEC